MTSRHQQLYVSTSASHNGSDVKSSRPKWPQNFGLGLGLEALALASNIWPRPGLDLVVSLCNRAFFGQKSCKIREFCHFSAI